LYWFMNMRIPISCASPRQKLATLPAFPMLRALLGAKQHIALISDCARMSRRLPRTSGITDQLLGSHVYVPSLRIINKNTTVESCRVWSSDSSGSE
jgi:hypothetical protein